MRLQSFLKSEIRSLATNVLLVKDVADQVQTQSNGLRLNKPNTKQIINLA
jgi:hypothetical protein